MSSYNNIYKYVAMAVLGLASATTTMAQEVCGMGVSGASLKRDGNLMTVKMNLGLGSFDLNGNRAAVFAPVIINGTDTLDLDPVGLYGRTRWFQYLRYGEQPLGGEGESTIRWSERPETFGYARTFDYDEWMNGAQLYLRRRDYGCCRSLIQEWLEPLAQVYKYITFQPTFRYVRPVAETDKTRELAGKAFIDFPVNMTNLYPDYRKNPRELAKIIATIDSIRDDKDITVKRITIKGWASPESPWSNNTRLAKGRTATLKEYVQNLYRFPEGFIETDYYPEDWFGLREFVAKSGLEHKNEILALIDDNSIEPDPKEALIKSRYPDEYKFLLATVYPGLRHSDYTIEYTIRQFTDIDEIRRIIATEPQKLSLNEMYLLAQTYEPGSREYNEVFEIAVRMYPSDPTANLNAANTAMSRGDLVAAEDYLAKAGNTPEVNYANGVLTALKGDYAKAYQLVEEAARGGMPDTQEMLDHLKEIMDNNAIK